MVYGLLGLTIFVKLAESATGGTSVLAAGFTMAVLVLPIVIITGGRGDPGRARPASARAGSASA